MPRRKHVSPGLLLAWFAGMAVFFLVMDWVCQ